MNNFVLIASRMSLILSFFHFVGYIADEHDPATDAIASMKLFKKYYNNPVLLSQAKQALLRIRPSPSWQKRNNYRCEGVCMAGFFAEKCFCGAPPLAKD